MSRWRPGGPRSTPIITSAGHAALKRELDELWHRRRPQVVAALAAAAAEGDRSENAEYSLRRRQLGEIDRRVRFLSRRLTDLRVSDAPPADRSAIYFGAWVRVVDASGVAREHRIVGPDETDAGRGWISIDSPLARAVLGRRAGETFEAPLPQGSRRLTIAAVRYEDPPDAA
jgi:transcription elongation factor GreB